MQIHDLKIDAQPMADLVSGAKTCEVRNDDRGFEVGDMVRFPGGYTRTISHIQRGYGLPDGLCVLSYAQASAAPEQEPVCYQFQDREGKWHGFADERHQQATIDSGDWPIRKLYTHADPSEVAQLRAELADALAARDKWGSNFQKAIRAGATIEQQLSEAQALLQRGVLVGRSELSIVRAALKRDAEERGMPVRAEILADLDSSIKRFDTLLSATAQPADGVKSHE